MGLLGGLGKIVGGVFGGTAGAVGGLIGDALDSNSAERSAREGAEAQNEWNANQAQINRDFQERMSNTSYQRAVKDMAAAGLNPMLAYSQGGASTPGGSGAAPASNVKLSGIQAAQVAAQAANAQASTDLIEAQADKTRAEKALVEAQVTQTTSSAGHLDAQKDQIRQNMSKFQTEFEKLSHETKYWANHASRESIAHNVDMGGEKSRIAALSAEAQKLQHQAKLLGLEVPESVSRAAFWSSDVGKSAPYVDFGARTVGSITGSASRAERLLNR